jgi:hypothetical protein
MRAISLGINVLVMTNELHLGSFYKSCHYKSYGTVVLIWFCLETAYMRASTLLSWVALWAFGFVRASVRARNGGCGSGSSLTFRSTSFT